MAATMGSLGGATDKSSAPRFVQKPQVNLQGLGVDKRSIEMKSLQAKKPYSPWDILHYFNSFAVCKMYK